MSEDFMSGLQISNGCKDIFSPDYLEHMRQQWEDGKAEQFFIAQRGAQESGLSGCADITVFGGNRGGGKANPYNTPVATPSGFRKMGELEVGDPICTPYDGVQKVSAIYEQGENTVYVLHFDDGTQLECMDNHRFWARLTPDDDFEELGARDIFNRYTIDNRYPTSLRKGVSDFVEIPLCGEVQMNEDVRPIDLPIHPYVLGYVCGTGFWHFAAKGLLMSGKSIKILSFRKWGYKFRKDTATNTLYAKNILDKERRMITTSRNLEAAHIPEMYKTASVEARYQFLQGVMYLKGHTIKKHPVLELPNKKLIMEVADLARSLGIWALVTEVTDEPKYMGMWRLTLTAPDERIVYGNEVYQQRGRVIAEIPKSRDCKGMLTKKILYITKSQHRQQCRCITVTGKEHLYLTNSWTVNHNTVTMLMEPMYDISNKYFNGIIFRKNKNDFENIINESKRWYAGLGRYNRSKDDMTWYFKTGAKLGLTTYDMTMTDFDIAVRGQQYAYIGVDELPQMPFEMFKMLMNSCRNTVGVHSRLLGTCNPDPLSWLRKFIDWWIGKEDTVYSDGLMHPERKGFVIPERNGAIRYCYMPDDSVDNICWGDTPEEVYEQCRELIDDAWNPEWARYGYTKTSFFVKSVTFIKADLNDNKALIKNDPGYIANLLNQPPEVRAREFDGNWDIIKTSDDMIKAYHLDRVFQNAEMRGDGIRRATCDVAGDGGDNCVTWLWIGWHVADVFVCRRDLYTTVDLLRGKLQEWGVLEQNFAYDLNGMGQVLKGAFKLAVPFNNLEAVSNRDRNLYDNKKSQCAYRFAERTQQAEWSIEPTLLKRTYKVGKETKTLYNILQNERKCVRQDMNKADRGWCLIHKEQMKNKTLVGHSPDFFEALFMREVFDIKATQPALPNWVHANHSVRSVRTLGFRPTARA